MYASLKIKFWTIFPAKIGSIINSTIAYFSSQFDNILVYILLDYYCKQNLIL